MRSGFEERVYKDLCKKYGKANVEYEGVKLPYLSYYYPDFVVKRKGKKDLYVEAKGYFRPESKRKMKAVKSHNPNADIQMVFQKDNWSSRTLRYSDWAKKHGFKYTIGGI